MAHEAFRPVNPKTLRNSVTDMVRQAILNGALLPGQQVNQAQIAAKLGTSRGPVREALRQLEEEGLVHNIPHKGAFVTEITLTYIDEIYSIRRVLEEFAVKRLIARADRNELKQLQKIVDAMPRAAAAGDTAGLRELDLKFHSGICRAARHELLMQLWKSIEVGVRRVLALRHGIYKDPRDIVGSHPQIMAAIAAGDTRRAIQLLDDHIREAGELLRQSWSNPPQSHEIAPPGTIPDALRLTRIAAATEA